jgi:copper(I)-binding protein
MRSHRQTLVGCLIAILLLVACSGEPKAPLVASDIVVTASMPGGSMSAGYISLRNNTDIEIRISKITSPAYEKIEIHESTLEDGIAKMRRIEALSIPPNSSVTLENGGKHLMLMRPTTSTDTVSLSFYSDDTIILSVNAPITPRNK